MGHPCPVSTGRVRRPSILVLVLSWMQISVLAAAKALPVLWSRNGLITCPETPEMSMIVVEEGFYTDSSRTCDEQCRPPIVAESDVTCFFRNDSCVQGLSPRDLAAIYDLCWPSSLPCNLSKAGLAASLVVRYSCFTGRIFDPFNATFNWKASNMFMSFYSTSLNANSEVITLCTVQSDPVNSNLSLHFTSLNFPQVDQETNSSDLRKSNDVIVHAGSESWHLSESLYPVWRRVSNSPVTIEFHMTPSHQKRPVWVSFREQNQGKLFEVICKPVTVPPTTMKAPEQSTQEIVRRETQKMFTLKELLLACGCTAVLFLLLVTAVCSVRYYTRKRRKRSDDLRNLIARFDNRSPEGAVAISAGTEQPTCCSDEADIRNGPTCLSACETRYSDLHLQRSGSKHSSPCQATSALPPPLFKEGFPPGSSLSNPSYENMAVSTSPSRPCSHESNGYMSPVEVTGGHESRQAHSRGLGLETSPLRATRQLPGEPSAGIPQSDSASGQKGTANLWNHKDVASLQSTGVLAENVEYEEIPALSSFNTPKC